MDAHRSGVSERAFSRFLIGAAALAVVGLVGVVVLLWPRESPPPARKAAVAEPSPPLEGVSREQLVLPGEVSLPGRAFVDAAAPELAAPTIDLFAEPSIELLDKGHLIVAEGGRLHSKRVKEVYEYGKEHPGDARPHLILALDSMNRGWFGFAASHYARAAKEDPRAKQDPRMLRDLLVVAGRKHDADKAWSALRELFGPSAIPEARKAIDDAAAGGDSARAAKLTELLNQLEQGEGR